MKKLNPAHLLIIPLGIALLSYVSVWSGYACQSPVYYSLVRIDEEFGIEEDRVLEALDRAEERWEEAVGKELFVRTSDGRLKVSFIYDERQKETEELEGLGGTIESSREIFSGLEREYENLQATYKEARTRYEAEVAAYNARVKKHDAEVRESNQKGGASAGEYKRFKEEEQRLSEEEQSLENQRENLSDMVDELNTLGRRLNQMAKDLNIRIEEYNTYGGVTQGEFEQGLYTSGHGRREITIYQYTDFENLVGVLTHEMGHALGLGHNESEDSVMYRLNHGENQTITEIDLSALERTCHAL